MDLRRRNLLRGHINSNQTPNYLPWLKSADKFYAECTRCYDCVEVCAENIIIKGDGGYPSIDFKQGECSFCRKCVQSCGQDLFHQTSNHPPWRNKAQISTQCLATQNISCQSCQDSCESRAIKFDYQLGAIPHPKINLENCTGCGACVSVCPNWAISIKPELNPLQSGINIS